jgi:hypothetical protein
MIWEHSFDFAAFHGQTISGRGVGAGPSGPGQAASGRGAAGRAGRVPRLRGAAITASGYVPNRAARSLVTGRSGSIGLVVSEPGHQAADGPLVGHVYGDPFFGRIASGLLSVLGPRHLHPVLIHQPELVIRQSA